MKNGEDSPHVNWVGKTWYIEFNNRTLPTLQQVETGLIAEAMEQLRLDMIDVKNRRAHIEAQFNIKETW